jgi:selenocysteine-specific elongation factor
MPGKRAPARVVLDEPVVARAGDRFVLRDASPVATLGGGVVADPLAPVRARPWPAEQSTPATLLARVVAETGTTGVLLDELPVRLGVAPLAVAPLLLDFNGWRVGARLLDAMARDGLSANILTVLERFHAEQPLESGAPLQWLRSRLRATEEVSDAVLASLAAQRVIVMEQGLARLAGFTSRLGADEEPLRGGLLRVLESAGQEPPSLDELAAALGASPTAVASVARFLAREGVLVAVEPSRYYPTATVDALLARLRAGMQPGVIYGPAELRELLGFSRKFLIPFLEFTDRAGHTFREAAGRRRAAT